MFIWQILKQTATGYVAHGGPSRGAAISFYSVTSLAPVLLIVIGVAGLAFGQEAVQGSLVHELSGMLGKETADLIQLMIARSSDPSSGSAATVFGVVMVLVTASGVFGEMQAGLNAAWDTMAPDRPILSIIRARAVSLGLVGALGFLLMISLAASTALTALGNVVGSHVAFAPLLLSTLNTLISVILFALLFGAIFKVLPDTPISWRDVFCGSRSDQPDVHGWQVADRLVPRSSRARFNIRCCRLAARHLAVGLLLLADFSCSEPNSPGRLPKKRNPPAPSPVRP